MIALSDEETNIEAVMYSTETVELINQNKILCHLKSLVLPCLVYKGTVPLSVYTNCK